MKVKGGSLVVTLGINRGILKYVHPYSKDLSTSQRKLIFKKEELEASKNGTRTSALRVFQ